MKIDNSRIFVADIYESKGYHIKSRNITEDSSRLITSGTFSYDEMKIFQNAVFVYFEENHKYVPVTCLKNMMQYLIVKLAPEDSSANYGYSANNLFMPTKGTQYLKNLRPLFNHQGKTSLAKLNKIDEKQCVWTHPGMLI